MSEIPFDIMCHILKLLPVKSLLRFRCLSKTYCSLIDSRNFINLHLFQSNYTNTNQSLITFRTSFQEVDKTYMMDLDTPGHHLVECDYPFSKSSLIPDDFWDHLKNSVIFGSCNGLIALYHPQEGMLLWNPSTKKHQNVPTFWGSSDKIRSSDYLLDGFGYDSVSGDYKVIRIRTRDSERRKRSRVMIYSVKHNCSRRIEEFPYNFSRSVSNRTCGILIGSCLHWVVSDPDDSDDRLIVGFNLEDERYRVVPIPDSLKNCGNRHMELGEVEGCLSMSTDDDDGGLFIEIWVMKEYGMKESWSRIFSVHKPKLDLQDYLPSRVKPIGYSKTCNRVFMDVHGCRFWAYDLQEEGTSPVDHQSENLRYSWNRLPFGPDNHLRRIEILGAGDFYGWDYSFIYVKSLVPVNFRAN
ncbi:F-box protein CPR1-like [Mercurialis annua]|uniref:F-box protein CPR1-like n=1 Tax=Mercurialis annua TaxID=3986 RepID=UPI0021602890|nr:F-box protein CPR1-like [Mercurialis annua]